ncbi:unnamed protein product [Jaminaea pallidilutea]
MTEAPRDPRSATTLYKILLPSDHPSLPSKDWPGAGIDLSDGFIHLSTSDQLAGTLQRFFAQGAPGVGDELWICGVEVQRVQDRLKWEPAAGTLFGHVYGTMNPAEDFTIHEKVVRGGADGLFNLPNFKF